MQRKSEACRSMWFVLIGSRMKQEEQATAWSTSKTSSTEGCREQAGCEKLTRTAAILACCRYFAS